MDASIYPQVHFLSEKNAAYLASFSQRETRIICHVHSPFIEPSSCSIFRCFTRRKRPTRRRESVDCRRQGGPM